MSIKGALGGCLRLAIFALAVLAQVAYCSAQGATSHNQSAEEPAAARVNRLFEQWDKPDTPGCSVAIDREGKVLYERGYGMASLELGVHITPSTVFHAASVAKMFTAISVMLLAQRGKLSLDDEVQQYIPELPRYGSRLTIRHLLSHTGGLRDVFELQALAAPAGGTPEPNQQFVQILAQQRKLNFEPAAEYQYSNGGYLLLATIVQRISGQSLRAFADANIFEPLGMRNTRFHDDPTEIIPNRASGYSPSDSGMKLAAGADPGGIVGNAGMFTTVEDLLRWAHNWDDVRVGTPALLDAMSRPTVLAGGGTTSYGLGLELGQYHGMPTVGHSGGNAGFVARLVRYPEQKLAVAVLCNRDDIFNVGELANNVADVYLPHTVTTSSAPNVASVSTHPPLRKEELASKEGLYQNPSDLTLLRVSVEGGKLMASIVGRNASWELTPVSPSRFTLFGGLVTLEFPSETRGQAQEIRVTDGEKPAPYLIQRVSPWVPQASELPAFAGRYRSAELGVTYTVFAKDSALIIKTPAPTEIAASPILKDTFAGDLVGVVVFSRDANNRVLSFTVNTPGVRGLRFDRLKDQPCDTEPWAPQSK